RVRVAVAAVKLADDDARGGIRFLDRVRLARGEAGRELVVGRVDDRAARDDVGANRAVAAAGVDGDDVRRAAAGDAGNARAGNAGRGQREVGCVDAGDALREGDGVVAARLIRRVAVVARDRRDARRVPVDGVDLAGC